MSLLPIILLSFLGGLISGMASSAPLGPSNFWVANRVLTQPRAKILSFTLGIIVCDIFYAFIAFWGYFHYLDKTGIGYILAVFGSCALIFLGTRSIIKQKQDPKLVQDPAHDPSQSQEASLIKDFVSGVVLCGFNPAFIMFWVFVAGALANLGWILTRYTSLIVFLGIAIGDVLWYRLFAHMVMIGGKKIQPKWIDTIQYIINGSIVLFGIFGLYETFFGTHNL